MTNKGNLPIEIHEHFRKANVLHGYVSEHLGEARNHALETGQELLAAKTAIPHGRWEDECKRLFDGSPRTARFYMAFSKDFGKLKTAEKSAVLMLEGTLDGAAKAAKKATRSKPSPPKRQPDEPINVDSESVEAPESPEEPESHEQITDAAAVQLDGTKVADNKAELKRLSALNEDDQITVAVAIREGKAKTVREAMKIEEIKAPSKLDKNAAYGKCPNCAGTKWAEDQDGFSCVKCHHPHGEPAGDVDEDRIKTQRQKTVKTVEALLRAFDDLQTMRARPEHSEAIQTCKGLLKTAKNWK